MISTRTIKQSYRKKFHLFLLIKHEFIIFTTENNVGKFVELSKISTRLSKQRSSKYQSDICSFKGIEFERFSIWHAM